jgi:DNA helicase HerA-like ATPase
LDTAEGIFIGAGTEPQFLSLKYANRHGLIAGATGTGKTVTLQVLAEGFSRAGVPVFMADVKGDLSGLAEAGSENPKLSERAEKIGLKGYKRERAPVVFWDLFGEQGHPVRTTVMEMGPLLLARILELNDTQEGVLSIAFQIADDQGLLLLDLKDLQSLLTFVAENAKDTGITYGNVSSTSVGAIQRRLLVLRQQGGEEFFGEPALDLKDFMRTTWDGRAFINILAADKLMATPRLYATFLLWLLSELFEELPEIGDPEKPKLVFFFDEAHLLFRDAPRSLIDKVETVVRLIRSKGVGVFFVTQNPLDLPETVLGQLGNRVQHALRAFTPRDQKAVRAAAETFRPNPAFKAQDIITELGVGQALVSTLGAKGVPSIVDQVLIRPPATKLGPCTAEVRAAAIGQSPLAGRYETVLDRESAHEILSERARKLAETERASEESAKRERELERQRKDEAQLSRRSGGGSNRQSMGEALAKSVLRSVGSSVGRAIVRNVLGSLFKGR